jgi:3-mercaptopyruvate sulfurtransferase SseA
VIQLQNAKAPLMVFDCSFDLSRSEAGGEMFAQSHMAGAVFADLDRTLSAKGDRTITGAQSGGRHPLPAREALAQWLRDVGFMQGMQAVVYDRQGSSFCGRLWWMLKWLGHEAVAVLDGGLNAWTAAGGATESGDAQTASAARGGNFVVGEPWVTLVQAGQVLDKLGRATQTIVDARATPRFRGEVEPLDSDIAAGTVKSASEADCEAAAFEFLALMTDRVAMEKKATCITSDILNSVAKGGVSELAKLAHDQNLEAITCAVKGASDQPADSGMKAVAAAAIFKSARLSPLVSCIAAAEYIDMLPGIAQACASMDEERMDKAAGLGALLHISLSRPEILQEFSKAASADHMPTALRELIGSLRHSPHQKSDALAEDEEDRDAAMTSDLSGSMGEDFEGGDNKDPDSDDESQADKDVIDAFMENPKSVPPPKH